MSERQVLGALVAILLIGMFSPVVCAQAQEAQGAKVSDWYTSEFRIERGMKAALPWNVSFRNGGDDYMYDAELRVAFTDLNITPSTTELGDIPPGERREVVLDVSAPVLWRGVPIGPHVVFFELRYREYRGATTYHVEELRGVANVTPARTSLTLTVERTKIAPKEVIDITATLLDVNGDPIWLAYLDFHVNGEWMGSEATTDFGVATYRWTPNTTGTYTIQVKHDGSPPGGSKAPGWGATEKVYVPNESNVITITVEKSGCIIATATFGSELAPEVQFLRGFRDRDVLSTFAGSQFMVVFNTFYYSFSPPAASFIAEHAPLRHGVGVLLYPLVWALQVASATFHTFSFSPELGVVFAGFVASSLLGIIYLSPLVALIAKISRKAARLMPRALRILVWAWCSSVLTMLGAEIVVSEVLMMTGTGLFVLATLGFAATLPALLNIRLLPPRTRASANGSAENQSNLRC